MLKRFLSQLFNRHSWAANGSESKPDLVEYSLVLTLIGTTGVLMLTAVGINVGCLFQ